jgi:predicted aspartyl protease
VLDTGATFTCVDSALAKELDLPRRIGVTGVGSGVRGGGPVKVVTIDSIEVGSARAEGVMACALDLSALRAVARDAQGLLGLNFLKAYRVTLDFASQTLTLAEPTQSKSRSGRAEPD